MFKETGAELPFATKVLVFISDALQQYGVFILGAVHRPRLYAHPHHPHSAGQESL